MITSSIKIYITYLMNIKYIYHQLKYKYFLVSPTRRFIITVIVTPLTIKQMKKKKNI